MASNELKLKIILEAFDKVTTPLERIRKSGTKTSKAFQNTQKALNALNRAQAATEAFKRTQDQIEKTKKHFDQYKEKLKETQAAIDGTKNPTDKQVKKLHELAAIVGNMPDKLKAQNEKLDQLKSKLQSAGGSTEHLGQYQDKLKNHIEKTNHALEREAAHIERVERNTKRLVAIKEKAAKIGSMDTVFKGVAAATPAIYMAKTAIEREESIAEITKVAKMTNEQRNQITARLKEMSNAGPAALAELSTTMSSAARQGIGITQRSDGTATIDTDRLAHFTDKSNKASIALGMDREGTAALMGHMLASGFNDGYVDKTLDQMSVLANKHGAHGEYNRDVFSKTLPLAKNANTQLSDIAALATLNDRAGLESEVAGTGIQHLLSAMVVGKSATRRQKRGFAATGHSAQEWQAMMAKNGGADTFLKLFDVIKNIPQIKRGTVLTDIFGKESAASIATMANNDEEFRKYRKDINDPNMLKNDGVNNEYLLRMLTTENKLKTLRNNFNNLAADLGTELLPQIKKFSEKLVDVIQRIDRFSEKHKTLISNVVKFAAVIGPIIISLAAVGFAVRTVVSTLLGLRKAIELFKILREINFASKIVSGIKLIRNAFISLTALMEVNPVILAITAAIVVLAGLGYVIYRNWDGVVKFFSGIWDYIKSRFSQGIGGIIALLADFSPVGILYAAFAKAANSLGFTLPATFSELGSNIIQGLIRGISSMALSLKETISGLGGEAISWFKEKLGIHSPSVVFHGLGGFIVDGLNNGISDNAHHPINRIRNLAEQVSAAFKPTLPEFALAGGSPQIITKSVFEEARNKSADRHHGNRIIQPSYTFNIYPHPNQSPAEIGQAVHRTAEDHWRKQAPHYSDTPDWVY